MTDTRRRARDFQRWSAAWLEERGWHVYSAQQKPVFVGPGKWFSMTNDVFASDLIARRGTRLIWVQTTHTVEFAKRTRNFMVHFGDGLLVGEELQVWVRVKGGDVRVRLIQGILGGVELQSLDVGRIVHSKFIPDQLLKDEEGLLYPGF